MDRLRGGKRPLADLPARGHNSRNEAIWSLIFSRRCIAVSLAIFRRVGRHFRHPHYGNGPSSGRNDLPWGGHTDHRLCSGVFYVGRGFAKEPERTSRHSLKGRRLSTRSSHSVYLWQSRDIVA